MIQYGNSQKPQDSGEKHQTGSSPQNRKIQAKNQPPAAKLKVPQKDLLVFRNYP